MITILAKERKNVVAGGYETVIHTVPSDATFIQFFFTFNEVSINNETTVVVKLYVEDEAGIWTYYSGATIQTVQPPEGEDPSDYYFETDTTGLKNKRIKLEYNANKSAYFGINLNITF